MTTLPEIEFYDISCTITKEPWAPYTARTYLAMSEIHPTLTAAGVTPKGKRHLLPAITLSPSSSQEKEWVTDSDAIASRLQSLYVSNGGSVSTSLFPNAAAEELAKRADAALETSLDTESRVVGQIATRVHGVEAKTIADNDGGIGYTFAKAMQSYVELYENKSGNGVWLAGDRPVYADLIVLAALQWYKCSNGNAFAEALNQVGGPLQKAWTAGQQLFKQ